MEDSEYFKDGADSSPKNSPSELEKANTEITIPEAVEEGIIHQTSNSLSRSLRGRHMQMIAMGGSIGAGLFVGSGTSRYTGDACLLVRMVCGRGHV